MEPFVISEQIIKEEFSKYTTYTYKFRKDNQELWKLFLSELDFPMVNYSNQELNYQLLYRKEKKYYDNDISILIYHSNKIIAIFPITIAKLNDIYEFTSFGGPILSPIFFDNCDKNLEQQVSEICFHICKKIKNKFKIDKLIFLENNKPNNQVSTWYKVLKNNKYKISRLKEAYINLKLDIGQIEKYLKKKKIMADILKAKKLWQYEIKYTIKEKEWRELKDLHIKVSGKQTRTDKTWLSQLQDINNKYAFAIFLYDKKKLIGGAMYRYTNSSALYAIGAYDRNLFPKPISHLAHFMAIEELKRNKFKWLKMGDIPQESDYNNPSKKEITIGLFKKKFSTDIFDKYIFEEK